MTSTESIGRTPLRTGAINRRAKQPSPCRCQVRQPVYCRSAGRPEGPCPPFRPESCARLARSDDGRQFFTEGTFCREYAILPLGPARGCSKASGTARRAKGQEWAGRRFEGLWGRLRAWRREPSKRDVRSRPMIRLALLRWPTCTPSRSLGLLHAAPATSAAPDNTTTDGERRPLESHCALPGKICGPVAKFF